MPSGNANRPSDLGPKVAATVHELYALFKPTWVQLSHVREGTGGFLATDNTSYLVAHPREWLDHSVTTANELGIKTTTLNPNPRRPSPKLKARRKIARYENVASAILESKKSVLFREQPTRRVGQDTGTEQEPTPLELWWTDVDGGGTHIDDAMTAWWDLAATFGHVVLYVDTATNPDATTAADQPMPYVRPYCPLDVLDWRTDDNGRIVWIKFLESYQDLPDGTQETALGITRYRVRVVDDTSWTVYDQRSGAFSETGTHNFGRVPVVYLFGKRRALLSQIGESVLGDPRNYIDLFNLTSEIRELLRNQTFSFLNIPLGNGPDAMTVEQAQTMMGQQTGAMNVLFSGPPANILSADAANIDSYHAEIARLKREIYRETGVQWEADSKDAEAAGSLELKREDMTVRISAYADECQEAEYELACLIYAFLYGADVGEQKIESDAVTVHYPERFSQTPFQEVLDQLTAAQMGGMPPIFLKALRKAIVTKFEGMANLPHEQLEAIYKAIDAAEDDPTPAERMRQKMELATKAVQAGGKPQADTGDKAA